MMTAATGRELWKKIHSFSKGSTSVSEQEVFFSYWMAEVESALSCKSCFQKVKWFLKQWPVSFGGNFHLWILCLHDYVNKEMGKPYHFPHLTLDLLTQHGIVQ